MARKRLMIGIGVLIIIVLIMIISASGSSLTIKKTQVDPVKVTPGKYMTIISEVESRNDIDLVYVEIPYEGGVDKIDMEKIASKNGRDIYQAEWLAHGLENLRWYKGTVFASDKEGNEVFYQFDFQDPTVNHTWPQINGANGCLISTTLTSCPDGYSVDTNYEGKYLRHSGGSIGDGGTTSHSHVAVYGYVTASQDYRERGDEQNWAAKRDHVHTVSISAASSAPNTPAYLDILLCCRN